MLASTATAVRTVRLSFHAKNLRDLRPLQRLSHLEVLGVHVRSAQQSQLVASFLEQSPLVPRELHLSLAEDWLHQWYDARRLTTLEVEC